MEENRRGQENRLQIISACADLICIAGGFKKKWDEDLHWKSFSSYLGLRGNSLPSLKSNMVWTGVSMAKTLAHSSSSWTSGSPPLLSFVYKKDNFFKNFSRIVLSFTHFYKTRWPDWASPSKVLILEISADRMWHTCLTITDFCHILVITLLFLPKSRCIPPN